MSVTPVAPARTHRGLITTISHALPTARQEAATALDRVEALE